MAANRAAGESEENAMTGSIVVGIDDSPRSGAALDWAVREARRHGLPLDPLYAWTYYVPMGFAAGLGQTATSESAEAEAREVLEHARARARADASGAELTVAGELVLDQPGPALVRASQQAAMVVLGSRGAGGLAGQLLGSVSLYVAGRAHSPVVVVPEHDRREREQSVAEPTRESVAAPTRVLLGLDVLHPVQAAIEFAYQEALVRDARLRVLHAWTYPVIEQPRFANPLAYSVEVADADARHALDSTLAPWREKYPQVSLEPITAHERASHALVAASAHAELLVVGAHRRGAHLPGLALGTINHAVLHHTHCPVAVVPEH